ncbi:MAG: elongation factor G [Clostridia bacterium]|nr:elongation factor G [Clostridia bacterium]
MKAFITDNIRNVVLLGHTGSGKTTLAEAMAYGAGLIDKIGNVSAGNTISDCDKEEIKNQFSISASVIPVVWNDVKINIIDAPGYPDFIGETQEAVSAADAAIIVVSGKDGVQNGTKTAWELCDKYNLPRMIFVSNMDDDNASFRQIVLDLEELYGKKIAPFYQPMREGGKFVGYINVRRMGGRRFSEFGKHVECDIPDYSMENLEIYREAFMEAVAETSEDYMERYFEGDTFTDAELSAAMRTNVRSLKIVPVSMGSAPEYKNIHNLLNDIVLFFPAPNERTCAGINQKTNAIFEGNFDFSMPKSAYVFKTIADPYIGKFSMIKVTSGVLKAGDVLYNAMKDADEKASKLYTICGNKTTEVDELHAGDIGVLSKLSSVSSGDTLSTRATPVVYGKTAIAKPYAFTRYTVPNKNEADKAVQAIQRMAEEDPTIRLVNDAQNRQTLLYGISEQHLAIVASKLLSKYKIEIQYSEPKTAYRETILGKTDTEFKYKKQSGGHGQYGHVKMRFSPSGDLESPFVFEEEVVGGTVPKNYFPAIEKGIEESVGAGPLAGYPVVGVKAVLYDGSYHPVDSSEAAFKIASSQAFKKGMLDAKPVLLEPIATLTIIVPENNTGNVIGDLNKRRARVLGLDSAGGGRQQIDAEIPMSALYGYSATLNSLTASAGTYSYEFVRYEQAPQNVQEAQIQKYQSGAEE